MKRILLLIALCVALFSSLTLQALDRESDSLALVGLYNSTEGAAWFNSWNLDQPMDSWFGVTLNDVGEVISLNLINNNLKGALPNLNLPALVELALSANDLRDTMPTLNFLGSLAFLDLSDNMLSGSLPDFNLPNLQTMRLHDNRLSGPIPDFSNLGSLRTLQVDNNDLSGGVPDFSSMPNLFNLRLSNNNLDGPLVEFNFLPNLLVIDLHGNNFIGGVPAYRGSPNLFILDLSDNDLNGFVPVFNRTRFLETVRLNNNRLVGPLPSFGALEDLQILDLANNQLGGSITSFPLNTRLVELNLSHNEFEGKIPQFTGKEFLTQLYLSGNQFTDTLPDLSGLPSLTDLRVDSNCLSVSAMDASLSTTLQILHVQNNQFTFSDLFDMNAAGLLNNFIYAPQKRIPMPDTIFATLGDNVIIDLVEDDGQANNTYQWFLDGNQLTALAVNELLLPNVNKLDQGIYHAIVANNFLPSLSLFSEEVLLLIDCPINVVNVTDTICQGDTLFVNGKPYFEAGVFTDTVEVFDPGTCDSVFVIDLSINPVFDTLIADTICADAIYIFGDTALSASGFYIDTLSASTGCDSIVRLLLTVHPTFTRVREVELCDGDTLFVGPFLHTETGIYFDTLQTVFGCDSVIISDVTVLDTFLTETNISLCFGETFEFRGIVYSQAGTYVDAFQTGEGCDSLFVLNLSIPVSDVYPVEREICTGDTVFVGDTFYTEAGTYIDSLVTSKGCDSIVMLTLSVVDFYELEFDFEICQRDTLFFGGDTLTAPGIYIDSLVATGGCDSIVKVRLNTIDFVPLTIDTLLCFGDSLVVGTSIYKVSGIFRDTLPSAGSCDTIVVSVVTVIESIRLADVSIRYDGDTNTGSVLPLISGGMGGYQYQWSNGSSSMDLLDVPSGTYELTVIDIAGCQVTFNFLVDTTTSIFSPHQLDAKLTAVPNPAYQGQRVDIVIEQLEQGEYLYRMFNVLGAQEIGLQRWKHKGGNSFIKLNLPLTTGTHFFQIMNVKGQSMSIPIVIH